MRKCLLVLLLMWMIFRAQPEKSPEEAVPQDEKIECSDN